MLIRLNAFHWIVEPTRHNCDHNHSCPPLHPTASYRAPLILGAFQNIPKGVVGFQFVYDIFMWIEIMYHGISSDVNGYIRLDREAHHLCIGNTTPPPPRPHAID